MKAVSFRYIIKQQWFVGEPQSIKKCVTLCQQASPDIGYGSSRLDREKEEKNAKYSSMFISFFRSWLYLWAIHFNQTSTIPKPVTSDGNRFWRLFHPFSSFPTSFFRFPSRRNAATNIMILHGIAMIQENCTRSVCARVCVLPKISSDVWIFEALRSFSLPPPPPPDVPTPYPLVKGNNGKCQVVICFGRIMWETIFNGIVLASYDLNVRTESGKEAKQERPMDGRCFLFDFTLDLWYPSYTLFLYIYIYTWCLQ